MSDKPRKQYTQADLPTPAMQVYVDGRGNLSAMLPEDGPGDTVFADDVLYTQQQVLDLLNNRD